jgi:hypothetical protein
MPTIGFARFAIGPEDVGPNTAPSAEVSQYEGDQSGEEVAEDAVAIPVARYKQITETASRSFAMDAV